MKSNSARTGYTGQLLLLRNLITTIVSQGEGFFLSAKDQPFQAWYMEPAV
ncbi:MAG: hypothetical protein ACOYYU_04070 [Chloroflexota bacterium]